MKLKVFSFLSTCVVSLVLATSASTFGYSIEGKMNNVQTTDAEKARDNVQYQHAKFVDSKFLATQSNQSHIATKEQDKTKIFTFMFATISFILILICVVAILSKFERYQNQDKPISKSLFEQVPCKKCQYFHENCYIQCAVHPTITLTTEAFNCPDFCPKA